MTDPIANALTQIRNAQAVGKQTVEIPFSRLTYGIAKILEQKGFVKSVELHGRKIRKNLLLALQYNDKAPAVSGVKRISKPGQRIYVGSKDLKRVKQGYGIAIISTSKGLMTDEEARKQRKGGEVLCEVW